MGDLAFALRYGAARTALRVQGSTRQTARLAGTPARHPTMWRLTTGTAIQNKKKDASRACLALTSPTMTASYARLAATRATRDKTRATTVQLVGTRHHRQLLVHRHRTASRVVWVGTRIRRVRRLLATVIGVRMVSTRAARGRWDASTVRWDSTHRHRCLRR